MKEVTKTEFFAAIGPENCHPRIEGTYPYTARFLTPQGGEVGRIIPADSFTKAKPAYSYLLPEVPHE